MTKIGKRMNNSQNKVLMDGISIENALNAMVDQIIQRKKNISNIAFVGIKTRGEHIAIRMKKIFEKKTKIKSFLGTLDITLYRDDFDTLGDLAIGETNLFFDVAGKRIILVDDVLYTGRTIRSALDQIVDFGRPSEIELAVLVDRGGREFPICAGYIGKEFQISESEHIRVHLKESDGIDQIICINN